MQPNTALRLAFVNLCLLILCAACVSRQPVPQLQHQPQPAAHEPHATFPVVTTPQPSGPEDSCQLNPLADLEERTTPEPDETIAQEVAGLKNLGTWEEGEAPTEVGPRKPHYDFPVTLNRQVEYYLDFFQHQQHATFSRWLIRSGRYLPMIQDRLAAAGLPLDLAYLPMIESGFSLTAYSHAHAVGPWQFIRATGRHYGLRIDRYVDERKDPVRATEAAISYLQELYAEFNSWQLAVAAYNAGSGTIQRAIRKTGSKNFWHIAQSRYLRLETKRYVPKLIAAIIIAKNPERYGFNDLTYAEPLAYDTVTVPRWTALQAVAVAAGTDFKTVRELNRELRSSITPPDRPFTVKVPAGTGALVEANLPRVQAVVTTNYQTHTVRKKDSVRSICRKYHLNTTTLLKANNLRKSKLTPGTRLRIPVRSTRYQLLAADATPTTTRDNTLVLHRVRPGESISAIARRYNVPTHLLASWNGLTDLNRIRAGSQLALYLDQRQAPTATDLASVSRPPVDAAATPPRLLTAKSKRKPATTVAAGTAPKALLRLTYYKVKSGDSLWTIARRYDLTTEQLRRWNNLRGNLIKPGRQLIIKQGDG